MGRLTLLALAAAMVAVPSIEAQSTPTSITCGIVNADGSQANGTIQITWPTFSSAGVTVLSGELNYVVENGTCSPAVALIPTDTATGMLPDLSPAYTVTTNVSGKVTRATWLVPTSGSPVSIASIQVSTPPGQSYVVVPSQISTSGASNGQTVCDVSGTAAWCTPSSGATWGQITGTLSSQTDLQTELNAKQATLGFTPANVANNLSDLASAATARTNLGLGTAATQASSAFLAAGGTAVAADALASTPTQCPSGQAPQGVAANGNAQDCQSVGGGTPDETTICETSGTISLCSVTVPISSAQILAFVGTPVTLVTARGAGTVVAITRLAANYIFGGTAYTNDTGDPLGIFYGSNTGPSACTIAGQIAALIQDSTNAFYSNSCAATAIAPSSAAINQPIVLQMESGFDPFLSGNGTLTIYAQYFVLSGIQ